jgi:hypothetical protein
MTVLQVIYQITFYTVYQDVILIIFCKMIDHSAQKKTFIWKV